MTTSLLELYEQIRKLFSIEDISDLSSEKILENVFAKTRNVDWQTVFSRDSSSDAAVSEDFCSKLRESGTKFFQNNKLTEAVQLYNVYIRSCHKLGQDFDRETKNQLIYQGKK